MLTSSDATYVIGPPFWWSVIEINTGVWAASIPSFKVLVKRFLPRLLQETSRYRRRAYSPGAGGEAYPEGSSGFNKLSNPNSMHMASLTKDGTMIAVNDTVSGWEMEQKSSNAHRGSYIAPTAESVDDRRTSANSQSSQEQMVRPNRGIIMRTTEYTVTSEGGRHATQGRGAMGLEV